MTLNTLEAKYNTATGWLCLDFANTVDWHASAHPEESLNSYVDLLHWAERVGIISAGKARDLTVLVEKKPIEAQAVLKKARAIREAIYEALSKIAYGQPAKANDLAILNSAIGETLRHSILLPKDDGFLWDWKSDAASLDFVLWPIVRSAAELMTSDALQRVGQCADEQGCGWLFWDSSRNKSRRWCDMRDCGNRAKARRFYKKGKPGTK